MATPTSLPATFVAGNVLTAAQMNDLRGAFRILQVVQTEYSSVFSTTSTSFVDVTGLDVTITPTAATSKVLLIANGAGEINANRLAFFTLFRGGASTGTNLGHATAGFGSNYSQYGLRTFFSIAYVDSPATTSATTYNVAIRSDNASGSASVMNGSMKNTILALEVSA